MAIIDTHAIVEDLITAGFAKGQAEALTKLKILHYEDIASKRDLGRIENSLKKDMYNLENSVKSEISSVKSEISSVKSEINILKWMIGLSFTMTLAMFSLTLAKM